MTEIVLDYKPRPLQRLVHDEMEEKRFGILVCHRRFGKTVLAINHLIRDALRTPSEPQAPPRYAYIAPYRAQAKSVCWDYLKHFTSGVEGRQVNEAELRVDLPNGARITLFGADNPDAMRGLYFDGVVLDEFGQMHRSAWSEVIRPALADRIGYALFLGTPKGKNAFHELYEHALEHSDEWMAHLYRVTETDILPDIEIAGARASMSEEAFDQEFMCSWQAAIQGSYYARLIDKAELEGRITNVPYDVRSPVITSWDLGFRDSTAIWFAQIVGREIRFLEYMEDTQKPMPDYVKDVLGREYLYGEHLGPHDIDHNEFIVGDTRKNVAAKLGLRFRTVPNTKKDDQIEAVRNLIPRSVFDANGCKQGLEALRHYSRKVNQRTGELLAEPDHNWASHGADAFATMALGIQEQRSVRRPTPNTAWIR